MNKILILSDTHDKLDPTIIELVQGNYKNCMSNEIYYQNDKTDIVFDNKLQATKCNYVIHCGDVCSQSILDQLADQCTIIAVLGNCDDPDKLSINSNPLKHFEYINLFGLNIAIAHKYGDLKKYFYGSPLSAPLVPPNRPGAATITNRHLDTPSYVSTLYVEDNKVQFAELIKLKGGQ